MLEPTYLDQRREASAMPGPGVTQSRPSRAEAEAAVRTLLAYTGEDPDREGLLETPARVIRAYDEVFGGYELDPEEVLLRTFEEVEGYDEMVLVRDIPFTSHCEHHMVTFTGQAHVAYLPDRRVVGLSKLARVVDIYARRLQVQEKLTVQVADTIDRVLRPRGVAVVVGCSAPGPTAAAGPPACRRTRHRRHGLPNARRQQECRRLHARRHRSLARGTRGGHADADGRARAL